MEMCRLVPQSSIMTASRPLTYLRNANFPECCMLSSHFRLFFLDGLDLLCLLFHNYFLLSLTLRSHFPVKYASKHDYHQLKPHHFRPQLPVYHCSSPPPHPSVRNLFETLRIVSNHAIDTSIDTPSHHLVFVDSPENERSVEAACIFDKACRKEKGFLQHVEGNVGDREEMAGIGGREANVGDGEIREVTGTEWEIFELLSTQISYRKLQTRHSTFFRMRFHRREEVRTAQQPKTTRLFQGLWGLAGTDLIVSPINRIRVSASLSTCKRQMGLACL